LKLFADSPLTSTQFHSRYKHKIIKECIKTNGVMDNHTIDFLINSNNLQLKLAVVNAAGWKKKEYNSTKFLDRLIHIGKYKSEDELFDLGTRDDLIVYAYLMSMDNYHEVSNARRFALQAFNKDSLSKSVAIIRSLIEAQYVIYSDFHSIVGFLK
jgi:hypothetical protein